METMLDSNYQITQEIGSGIRDLWELLKEAHNNEVSMITNDSTVTNQEKLEALRQRRHDMIVEFALVGLLSIASFALCKYIAA